MGCALGSLLSSVTCCCGSAACSLCCKALPSMKNSTSSRLGYAFFLIIGALVSAIMLIPGLGESLKKLLPGVCTNISIPFIIDHDQLINCTSIIGYFAVYRICFALVCFYAFFMLIMVYVRNSNDPRAAIQNGFWFFKVLALIGICIGAFYIPQNTGFEEVFMYFGIIGGSLFIMMQLILIIDFAHSWNESWVEKFEDGDREYYYGLLFFTAIFYIVALVIAILGYIYYASVSLLFKLNEKKTTNFHLIYRTLVVDYIFSLLLLIYCCVFWRVLLAFYHKFKNITQHREFYNQVLYLYTLCF